MDEATRKDLAQWTGCIAGALTRPEFEQALTDAGLTEIEIGESAPRPRPGRVRDHQGKQASRGVSDAREIHLHDPQTLYRHWEESQWSPFAIALAADREQWQAMEERTLVSFVLGSLMVAEERITTKFSGLVGAHGSEEEATFLATQQVDEARHMQFYARFQDEVVSEPAPISAHVERAREQLSPAFRTIFDDKLVAAHERLLANPQDIAAKVAFVTIYHQILEGTLGLTTFEFSTRFMQREGLLPDSSPATQRSTTTSTVTSDTAPGTLREAIAQDPDMAAVVRATMLELLPAVAESLTLPGEADASALGASEDELRTFALGGLSRRLKLIGVSLEAA